MAGRAKGYAATTTVSVARSQTELTALLEKHGAKRMVSGQSGEGYYFVAFELEGVQYKLEVRVPSADTIENDRRPRQYFSWSAARRQKWVDAQREQEARRRWRVLILVTKAKLEYATTGMSSVREEFLSTLVLPDGRTMGNYLSDKIDIMLQERRVPQLPLLTGN